MKKHLRTALAAALVFLWGQSALAGAPDLGYRSVGVRAGFGLNPHQAVLGSSGDIGLLFPRTQWLLPVLDLGLGDRVTWLSLTTALLYHPPVNWGGWQPYAGGDIGLQAAYRENGTDTSELGFSVVLGMDRPVSESDRFGLELKFAIIEAPSFRFMVTWANGL